MFVPTSDHVALTSGLRESKAFTFEMNAFAFHSVINGIYADKIRAPFRELCTNARDGHAVKGNLDQPFDVQLPSHLDPTFMVRDYGCSLTHDEVMGLYSTMFASSKRDDNVGVGMIGLGSKSPFAYTNIFSVSCWQNGRVRHYSCFIGEDDVPQVALVAEVGSNEPDGVKVSFGVKTEDVSKFRAAADAVLFGFDPKPNILNETFEFSQPEVMFEGDGWTLYKDGTVPFRGPMARQGCVLYPLDQAPLGLSGEPLFTWACVIDFPIGDLTVSTSRESLGYDDRTRTNVINRITEVKEKMTFIVQDEIDACPTWLDACVLLQQRLSNGNPIWRLLANSLTYKGQPLTQYFKVHTHHHQVMIMDPERSLMGVVRHHVSFRESRTDQVYKPDFLRDKVTIYYEPDGTKLAAARMRQAILDNTDGKTILWFRSLQPTIFGDKDVIDLSTVKPRKPDKVVTQTRPMRYFDPARRYWKGDRGLSSEVVELKPGMVYVEQEGKAFRVNGSLLKHHEVHNLIYSLKQAEVLPADTKVYCVNKVNRKVLDRVKMTPLHEAARESLREMLKTTPIEASDTQTYYRSSNVGVLRTLSKDCPHPLPGDLTDYCQQVEATGTATSSNGTVIEMYRKFLPDEFTEAQRKINPLVEAEATIKEKYPLLGYIAGLGVYNNDRQKLFNHYMELCNK